MSYSGRDLAYTRSGSQSPDSWRQSDPWVQDGDQWGQNADLQRQNGDHWESHGDPWGEDGYDGSGQSAEPWAQDGYDRPRLFNNPWGDYSAWEEDPWGHEDSQWGQNNQNSPYSERRPKGANNNYPERPLSSASKGPGQPERGPNKGSGPGPVRGSSTHGLVSQKRPQQVEDFAWGQDGDEWGSVSQEGDMRKNKPRRPVSSRNPRRNPSGPSPNRNHGGYDQGSNPRRNNGGYDQGPNHSRNPIGYDQGPNPIRNPGGYDQESTNLNLQSRPRGGGNAENSENRNPWEEDFDFDKDSNLKSHNSQDSPWVALQVNRKDGQNPREDFQGNPLDSQWEDAQWEEEDDQSSDEYWEHSWSTNPFEEDDEGNDAQGRHERGPVREGINSNLKVNFS